MRPGQPMGGLGQSPGILLANNILVQTSRTALTAGTAENGEVNLAASKSYGHGPDCCISFSHPALQPEIKYRPTLWVRQTDEPV
ncbi:hypothetical protein V8C43DRAFT_311029 [Trichoderma afarasin]